MIFRKLKSASRLLRLTGAIALVFAASEAAALQCNYSVTNNWGSGFTGNMTVTNDSVSTINGWQVQWQHSGSTVTSSWNATVSGSNPYTAGPVSWNATLVPGATQSFGFQGNGSNATATILSCTAAGSNNSSVRSALSSSTLSSSSISSATTLSSSSSSNGCAATAITPHVRVDGGSWQQAANATIAAGSSVEFGPHPTSGSWSWSGCGTSGSSRAQTVSPSSSCTATATYTNSCGTSTTQAFVVTVETIDATDITIEENTTGFCSVNGSIDTNNGGFTGTGFANSDNTAGAGVEWRVSASAGEYHTLEWRYANASANNRAGRILVNGVAVATVDFPSTGAWNSWTVATTSIALNAGENTIRLEAVSGEGLGNIDSLKVVGSNPQPVACGGSNSSSSMSSSSSAAGNDGDFYVAVGGSDSNSGSITQPFATLQKAIDAASPGQLVYIRGGVYRIVNPAIPSSGVNFWKSGTSDSNRIRYFAYPGERPVFDFANLRIRPDPNYTYGVNVTGSYLHLKGLEIRNVPMNTRSNTGLRVEGDAYRNIFELLDIHHIAGTGVFVHTTRGGHLFLNVDSHNNYDPCSHQGNGQNGDGFGVHYQKTGDVTMFRGCRAWWNSDDGWDFISQEVPVIVENSWAMGSGYINSGSARAPDGNGAGFKIGSSKNGIRHIVRNNLAWGNRNQGFYANHSAGGNDWYNNTAYNNGVQYDMWASSWDSNGNRTDGVILTGNKRHRMRNNIGYPNRNRNMQGVDEQFNTWNLGISPRDSDFMSLSDTGFMSPRNADGSLPVLDFLKLRAGSQMIDKGTNVGLPYSGSAPDLGAYER